MSKITVVLLSALLLATPAIAQEAAPSDQQEQSSPVDPDPNSKVLKPVMVPVPGMCGKATDIQEFVNAMEMKLLFKGTWNKFPTFGWLNKETNKLAIFFMPKKDVVCMMQPIGDFDTNKSTVYELFRNTIGSHE